MPKAISIIGEISLSGKAYIITSGDKFLHALVLTAPVQERLVLKVKWTSLKSASKIWADHSLAQITLAWLKSTGQCADDGQILAIEPNDHHLGAAIARAVALPERTTARSRRNDGSIR